MKQYIIDPELEKCLPPLDKETYEGIKESIAKDGFNSEFPIVIWKERGIIVDGHHRYKICQELGKEPVIFEKSLESMEDAVYYALEHQENRRSLLPSQKAIIGTKRILLKERIDARNRKLAGTLPSVGGKVGESSDIIAAKLGVGRGTVERVITVLQSDEPELVKMLTQGEIKAEAGDLFIKNTPQSDRFEIISNGPGAVKAHVRTIRSKRKAIEKELAIKEEQAKEKAEIQEYREVLEEQFGGSRYSCGLSSVFEMWCNSCKCAFDIFKPMVAKCCPVCAGNGIEKREDSWYPGKKVD